MPQSFRLLAPKKQTSGRHTAKIAKQILKDSDPRFRDASNEERKNLMVAFAKHGVALEKDAFDLVRCPTTLNLLDLNEVEKRLNQIRVYEVKGTREQKPKPNFGNHFFSLSTSELLAAQNLGRQYQFAFVNIMTHEIKEWPLRNVLSKAKMLYPEWAIRFR